MIQIGLSNSEKTLDNLINQIKKYGAKKLGVVVLFTHSYDSIKKILDKKKIKCKNCLFVDTVGNKDTTRSITTSPRNLTSLSITITESLQSLDEKDSFILFDSITPLLVYNDPNTVSKFLLFTLRQIKDLDINASILVDEEKLSKEVLPLLKQISDKIVKLKK